MKPPARQDYGTSERTDPGAAEVAADAEVAEADDEFPSEATRVDGGAMAGRPTPAPSRRPGAPAGGNTPTRSPAAAQAPVPSAKQKLAALQSLSLGAGEGSAARLPPQPKAQGGGGTLPWILLFLVVAGVGGNYAWQRYHGPAGAGGGKAAPAVRIETVSESGGTGQTVIAAGYIAPQTPISMSTPAGGFIKDVKVNNGDKFKKGALLVQLDDSAARAELVAARAELSAAESKYSSTYRLFKAGAATPVDVSAAQGAVAVARGKLAPINQRVEQTRIIAPIEGTVLERLAQPGETVSASTPVVKIADLTQLAAEADVTEGDFAKLHRGQAVKVTSDAVADRVYDGKVYEIGQQADKVKGTVLVKVQLHVPDGSLKPGMSVKCTFPPDGAQKPKIMISKEALFGGAVWLVGADNRVTRRAVQTASSAGTTVEVLGGLQAGDRIVLDTKLVREGQLLQ